MQAGGMRKMGEPAEAVRLSDVAITFHSADGSRYAAVAPSTLVVAEGEFVAIVGPTGCGKSTLLNAAAGLLAPSGGEVFSLGRKLVGLNRDAGYLFQQDALMPWKTARDNVAIGLEVAGVARGAALLRADAMLARVQNDLFDTGADLCVPGEMGERLRLTDAPSLRLEAEVAAMNAALPGLTSFVLPGGTAGAAFAHVARTIVRRAERRVVALSHAETVNPAVVRYLNRLSDHLFVLGRRLNDGGKADVLWVPGANR